MAVAARRKARPFQGAYAAAGQISDTVLRRRVVTLAKLTPERGWLGGVP